MNARGDGLVHACEYVPKHNTFGEPTSMGYTWCMRPFTWASSPRFHAPRDQIEQRYEPTHDVPTCLSCYAAEMTPDSLDVL